MRSVIRSPVMGGIALVLSALATGLPAQQWHQSPTNGHVYTVSPATTWHQAEDFAVGLGGHLATVRSQAEQDWLLSTFGTQGLWIGLNDEAIEGSFVWSSGEPVTFTNWATGEPTGPTDADFTLADGNGWDDVSAGLVTPGIIEVADLASYLPFGIGCPGTVGIPVLAAADPPRIDNTFTVRLSNLPVGTADAFVVFGFSKTDFAGLPLPVVLNQLGLFHCFLFVGLDVVVAANASGGTAQYSFPIPNDPDLLGMPFYNQGLVLDPGVNPFLGGAVLTNAGEGIIGASLASERPLVVNLKGAARESDPLPGVRVLRHDPVTSAFIEERTTDAFGQVNFGMIGAPRTTISVFLDSLASDSEATLFTLVDIEVGSVTLTLGDCPTAATFNVEVSGIPPGSNLAHVSTSGYIEGEHFAGFGTPPTIAVLDVEACQLQADGNVSMIISSRNSNTGNFSAAAFLLDEDPAALEGTTVAVNVNPANLTSVSWTSATPITPSGGVMQRNGVRWNQFLGFAAPATSGTSSLAIPPGTDRMDFVFAARTGPTTICVDHIFATVPFSIGVSVPDMEVETLSRNGSTISWNFTGTDTGDLDLLFGEFDYADRSDNSIQWRYLVTPTATSFTLPGLPADLASLTPPAVIPPGEEFFYVEAVGLDNVEGFDAFMSAVEPFMGNFGDFLFGSGTTRAIFLQRQEVR